MNTTSVTKIEPNHWNKLIPLESTHKHNDPYPVHCFPKVALDSIVEIQDHNKIPLSMIGNTCLATMSLASQGFAQVVRDANKSVPISLFCLSIAQSGERKSTVDGILSKPIRDKEKLMGDIYDDELSLYHDDVNIYQTQYKCILNKLKKSKPGQTDRLKKELTDLKQNEPKKPLQPYILYEDVTIESLITNIGNGYQSCALWTDEGAALVGGYSMGNERALNFMGITNKLWDGSDYKSLRKVSESSILKGRRLTVNIALQPSVMEHLMDINRGQARGTGFMSRFLIANPTSTKGTRMYKVCNHIPATKRFYQQLSSLLNEPLPLDDKGRICPSDIHLTDEAKQSWITYFNAVEKQLAPDKDYVDVSDVASKSAEQALRIAGVFHVFDNLTQGNISNQTMRSAIELALWYLNESKTFLLQKQTDTRYKELSQFIHSIIENSDNGLIHIRDISRLTSPSKFRPKQKRDLAINELIQHNMIRLIEIENKQFVQVHPELLTQERAS